MSLTVTKDVHQLRSQLSELVAAAGCAFRHELGWKYGGFQQPTCSVDIKHRNLLCAHNEHGSAPVKEALTLFWSRSLISPEHLHALLALLSEGTNNLYAADVAVHYAALRQMSRDKTPLCGTDRALAHSQEADRYEQMLLRGEQPSQVTIEQGAREAQALAGRPIKLVALLCDQILADIADAKTTQQQAALAAKIRKRIGVFLKNNGAVSGGSLIGPWAQMRDQAL